MSKRIIAALFAVVITCAAFINNTKDNDAEALAGMWELESAQGRPSGFIKALGTDGKVSNILPTKNGYALSMKGTYEVTSANTFVEKIEKSFYPALNGSSNKITYKKIDDQTLELSFLVDGEEYKEKYRKLSFVQ